jgi:hypothetical protein
MKIPFALLLLAPLAWSCKDAGPAGPTAAEVDKTLTSLTKVSDHPLYTMRFYGDYGFAQRVGLARSQTATTGRRMSGTYLENPLGASLRPLRSEHNHQVRQEQQRIHFEKGYSSVSPTRLPSYTRPSGRQKSGARGGDRESSEKNNWNITSRTKRPFSCERMWVERREQRDVCFVREDLSQYLCSAQNTPLLSGSGTGVRRSTPGDSTWGCTCFAACGKSSDPQFGRNFDWHDCIPLLLFTNPPHGYASVSVVDLEYLGYSRTNLPDGEGDKAALLQAPWWPFDGMNEKGVSVGMMAVPSAQAPYESRKVSLGELATIRLLLDFAATTEEAVSLLGQYNLVVADPPVHYLIADAGGHSAVIEYVNGTMSVIRNSEPWHVSTNFIITGSGAPTTSPCWRYNTAYSELKASNGVITGEGAMTLLSKVSQTTTIWSIVYGLNSGTARVAMGRKYGEVLEFSFGQNLPPKP